MDLVLPEHYLYQHNTLEVAKFIDSPSKDHLTVALKSIQSIQDSTLNKQFWNCYNVAKAVFNNWVLPACALSETSFSNGFDNEKDQFTPSDNLESSIQDELLDLLSEPTGYLFFGNERFNTLAGFVPCFRFDAKGKQLLFAKFYDHVLDLVNGTDNYLKAIAEDRSNSQKTVSKFDTSDSIGVSGNKVMKYKFDYENSISIGYASPYEAVID
ncbi:hypothetical protein [Vibrio alginolyticus]|uniref:hypothetical protein n=1 Tax=Vibrio TaxID=662 RepID=UPI0006CA6BD5|nr:hypothetical protein [Vibrio alginolyticus]KPM97643.1 hypothetical protein AOG25_14370 [Vibrio alginolyticus]CAH7207319.1 conserved hypothetical protein [Vibrio chagasii]CAH7375156.1 conserved hypothetical protein [Vibrio chagasii]